MTDKLSDQLRYAMAFSRRDFIDRAHEYISGAIREFYKAKLARKNGLTEWVTHWDNEAKRLVNDQLAALFLHPIRGFKNKKQAATQAFEDIFEKSAGYQRIATTTVKRDFNVTGLVHSLDVSDADEFREWVLSVISESED